MPIYSHRADLHGDVLSRHSVLAALRGGAFVRRPIAELVRTIT